jgi:tetratricopeptide (TPR) repeat protein
MRDRIAIAGLLGAVLLLPSPLHADAETPAADSPTETATPAPPPAAPPAVDEAARQRARVFVEAGIAHYRNAYYADALRSFQQALASFDSPVFVFNLARTCDRLRDVACALRHYREYRRRQPDSNDRAEVDQRIQALEADLATRGVSLLTVESTPAGAELLLDGSSRGKTPWVGEVLYGKHDLRLTMAGYSEVNAKIDVESARESELAYPMHKAAVPPPSPAVPALTQPPTPTLSQHPGPSKRVSVLTYVVSGAGVAALGGALVYELLSRQSEQQVRERPVQVDRVAAYDAMTERQTTARVLLGVGLGLTAVGATLLVFDLRSPSTAEPAVTAHVETRGTSLALRGTW